MDSSSTMILKSGLPHLKEATKYASWEGGKAWRRGCYKALKTVQVPPSTEMASTKGSLSRSYYPSRVEMPVIPESSPNSNKPKLL